MPDTESGVLMLSLQDVFSTKEALESGPFHSGEKRRSMLIELSALLKREKSQRKNSKMVTEAEENAPLVIGGCGTWTHSLHPQFLKEFAVSNLYNVSSYADLLRIIRNTIEHCHENPNAMTAQLGVTHPDPE